MALQVTADLRVDADGVRARVRSIGDDIVVDAEEPWAVVREIARATRLRGGDLVLPGPLTATRLTLRGPHGDVAHVPLHDGRRVRRRDLRLQRPQDLLSPAQGRVVLTAAVVALLLWARAQRS